MKLTPTQNNLYLHASCGFRQKKKSNSEAYASESDTLPLGRVQLQRY